MTHFVLLAEWCIDYDGGTEIVGVYHDEEEAKKAFKNRVTTNEKILAEQYDYKIYTDTEYEFDAGEDGEHCVNHITLQLIKV